MVLCLFFLFLSSYQDYAGKYHDSSDPLCVVKPLAQAGKGGNGDDDDETTSYHYRIGNRDLVLLQGVHVDGGVDSKK